MVGRLRLLAFDAVVAVASYISDGTRPIMCLSYQFSSSQLAEVAGKDIIVVSADHFIVYGIIMALLLIAAHRQYSKAIIFTDNQAAIRSIHSPGGTIRAVLTSQGRIRI